LLHGLLGRVLSLLDVVHQTHLNSLSPCSVVEGAL
jgi:hypothetical protein